MVSKHLSKDRCFSYCKKEDTNGIQKTQHPQTRIATVMDADIDRRHYIASVKDELNITVRDLNGRIGISMPYLLPKNRSVDSENYIIEPLVCALQGYIEKHHPEKIRHALVIIRSVYTDDNKKLLRDNDNIEIRHVINIISTMLLVDDNMLDILLCSRVGKTTHTEIIILLKRRKNRQTDSKFC